MTRSGLAERTRDNWVYFFSFQVHCRVGETAQSLKGKAHTSKHQKFNSPEHPRAGFQPDSVFGSSWFDFAILIFACVDPM